MGLDQYLYCNTKSVCKNAMTDDDWMAKSGICAYWRKANQIHGWFVDNVQEGEDDCGTYDVSVEELMKLRDVVRKVLASTRLVDGNVTNGYTFPAGSDRPVPNIEHGKVLEDPSVAMELLPVRKGFFFGGDEYNQWYWQDLEYTADVLDRILASVSKVKVELVSGYEISAWCPNGENDWIVNFQYRSSW